MSRVEESRGELSRVEGADLDLMRWCICDVAYAVTLRADSEGVMISFL